ncbi:hypothetical protein RUND412_005694 [Rhizina undulata]
MGLAGANGKYPCRTCNVQGTLSRGDANGRGRHYYFPHTCYDHELRNFPLRTNLHQQITDVCLVNSREYFKETGISSWSVLLELRSIHFPRSFPADVMHMVLINITSLLFKLWTGDKLSFDKPGTGGESEYVLPHHMLADIGEEMRQGRNNWKQLLLAYHLMTQHNISATQIEDIRNLLCSFVKGFESLYYNGDPARLSVCTANVHALLHVADQIVDCGPVWAWWQFGMERVCRQLKPLTRSKVELNKNLMNACIMREHLSHLEFARNFTFKAFNTEDPKIRAAIPHLLGPPVHHTLSAAEIRELRMEIASEDCCLENRQETELPELIFAYKRFFNGKVTLGSTLSQRLQETNRASNFVAFNPSRGKGQFDSTPFAIKGIHSIQYGRIECFLDLGALGNFAKIEAFEQVEHLDLFNGNRIIEFSGIHNTTLKKLVQVEKIRSLVGSLTDQNISYIISSEILVAEESLESTELGMRMTSPALRPARARKTRQLAITVPRRRIQKQQRDSTNVPRMPPVSTHRPPPTLTSSAATPKPEPQVAAPNFARIETKTRISRPPIKQPRQFARLHLEWMSRQRQHLMRKSGPAVACWRRYSANHQRAEENFDEKGRWLYGHKLDENSKAMKDPALKSFIIDEEVEAAAKMLEGAGNTNGVEAAKVNWHVGQEREDAKRWAGEERKSGMNGTSNGEIKGEQISVYTGEHSNGYKGNRGE